MSILNDIRTRASKMEKTIVFPEGDDIRVVKAANYLVEHEICNVYILADRIEVLEEARKADIRVASNIIFINPKTDDRAERYAELYQKKRDGISKKDALKQVRNPLYFGAFMVDTDEVDGCVAGSMSSTPDVMRAAIRVIGLKPSSGIVSSIFLMSFENGATYTYADPAVVPYPTAEELSTITLDAADTHKKLTGNEPIVAMLSFSTKGSADHESVHHVREAYELVKSKNPDFIIDGELQFDAAVNKTVAEKKAPTSPVGGRANVFIFPNLDAGNIAYKITERLAGATATGPIIQGLNKPMMDLSRGCNWVDIADTACVCILMT